jgi:PAS domain S-box-containing protein
MDEQRTYSFETIGSTLALLGAGERLVILCPSTSTAEDVTRALLRSARNAKGCLLVRGGTPPWPLDEPEESEAHLLAHIKDAGEAHRSLRKRLSSAPARVPIILTFSGGLPRWLNAPKSVVAFLEEFGKLLLKSGRTGAVILPSDVVSGRDLALLKDAVEFFVDLFSAGGVLFVQFLKAAGVYKRGFFLPRRILPGGREMRLGAPAVIAAAEDEVASPIADLLESAYRTAFDGIPEAVVVLSQDGVVSEANRRAVEILGWTDEEMRSLALRQCVPHDAYRKALRALLTLRKTRKVVDDVVLRRKNGRTFPAGILGSRISDLRTVLLIRDISGERKSESAQQQAEHSLRLIVDRSPHPQALLVNRRFVSCNPAFRHAFPWVPEEGASPGDLFRKKTSAIVKELTGFAFPEVGVPSSFTRDVSIAPPEGTPRDYEMTATPVVMTGGRGLLLTLVDVTERVNLVRTLKDSEQRFRVLIDNSLGAVSVFQEGKFAFVNRAFLELFGLLSADHIIGQEPASVLSPRDRKTDFFVTDGNDVAGVRRAELTAKTHDGRRLVMEISAERHTIGGVPSLLCYWHDVSERKQADQSVRRRAREIDLSEKVLSSLHASLEPQEVMQAGLDAALRWLGFDGAALFVREGEEFLLAINHGVPEPVAAKLSRQPANEGLLGYVAKTSEPLVLLLPEYPPHLPYRSLFEQQSIQTVAQIPLLHGQSLQGIVLLCGSTLLGVDDRDPALLEVVGRHFGNALAGARTFDTVRKLEERYHRAVDALDDIVYQALPSGALTFVSPQAEKLLGHRPDELVRNPDLWRSLCHPDDRSRYSERMSGQVQSADTHEIEYRILPRGKAAYRWIRERVFYRRDPDGSLTGLTGVVRDVTDRVALQEEVAQAKGQGGGLLDRTEEGIVAFDEALRCTVWNSRMEQIIGIARTDAIGKVGASDIRGFDSGTIPALVNRAAAGEHVAAEVSFRAPDGDEEKVLSLRFGPGRNEQGLPSGVVGTVLDHTVTRHLEREVRESQETLRNLIDAMGDSLLISDLQGKVWDVNKEFLALTGFARDEVVGATFPYPWLLDEEMANFMVWIAALREKRYLRDFDMTWQRKDGARLAISLNTTLLRNAVGEPVAMLNIARDISERKRLANELTTKNRQIEMLNRVISKANSTVSFEDVFSGIAHDVSQLLAFDAMTVALVSDDGQNVRRYASMGTSAAPLPVGSIVPLSRTVSRLAIANGTAEVFSDLPNDPRVSEDDVILAEGIRSAISIPIRVNNRILGTLDVGSGAQHAFTGTELSFLQPVADQVGALIDRTQLFQRVSDDSKYIHNLLNSIESVVYTVDPDYRIRDVNKAWRAFAETQGLTTLRDEAAVIGMKIEDLIVVPSLWTDLLSVMPQLFARHLDVFTRDFEVSGDGVRRTFHLVVSPMVIDERVTGLVFTFTDITEIKRREAEIRRRNRELIALNAISTSLGQSLNLEEVLDVAADGTKEILGAKAVLCYLWDEDARLPLLFRSPGIPAGVASTLQSNGATASLARSVMVERRLLYVQAESAGDERLSEAERRAFQELGARSVAGLPLISKDRGRGVLLVGFAGEHEFSEQEGRFLDLIGNNIASAIENAQLYGEVQDQVRVVTSLFELGKRLTGALDRRTVFEVLSDEVRKSIPFASVSCDAVTGEGAAGGCLFAVRDPAAGEGENDDAALMDRVREEILQSHQPYLGEQNGVALLAAPVRTENRVSGILSVRSVPGGHYDVHHLRILESIANLAGIALDRAALYDDTVAKSLEIQQRNRELDDFTYVVSHDLKEPLITIEGYSKIVLGDYGDKLDQQGTTFLSAIVHSTARMKSLIDDLLVLSRVGRVADSQEDVNVNDLLEEILREFEFTLREKGARVEVPPSLPVVRYNPTQLGMVFRNLIGNGLKFNDKPSAMVEIGASESAGEYIFSVRDNGIGIEEQHFEKIFVIFQRLHRTDQYQGTGAGLTIVKKIIENHGGRIWLESTLGSGTTFTFTVPKH